MAEDCVAGHCAQESFDQARAELPVDVDFTAIYSRRDGIVDWRACIDPAGQAREVRSSHTGMAFDPVVIDIVTVALRHIHNQPLDRRTVGRLLDQERRAG